jgi:ubiquitin-activating enzyme E1
VRNGLAKQLKTPITMSFKTFEDCQKSGEVPVDGNMLAADFLKLSHHQILHIAFETLDIFQKKHSRMPKPWNAEDTKEFLKLAAEGPELRIKDYKPADDKKYTEIIQKFCFTCDGGFASLAAFMGGYVSQEIVKAITNKFMPTKQYFYTDCYEVIPDLAADQDLETALKTIDYKEETNRYNGLNICIGKKLFNDLSHAKLFMVGAGAIGCELLKNYAMLGVGTGGSEVDKITNKSTGGLITLTDPDVIETSNLNRQFLFREKHLRKPKSQTAAAAAIQMNKYLKGHIVARLDKVHEGTSHIFTDKFFEDLKVVTNALDNVQARRYVDMRCVTAKTPLLESGTLGPKGHVQVIIPYKTESYGSQQDPQEEGEIPHCTLKMFPEETLHCVEWSRDKFGKLFSMRPKGLMKILDDPNFKPAGPQELKTLREAVTLLKKKPTTFDDCIRYARQKFQKYFVNDIRQLMFTYPLDAKTKQGAPFWSLPKRPPTEIQFDPKDALHASFITAIACLRANIFNIPTPTDARKETGKLKIAEEAAKVKVVDYKPSEEKKAKISAEVDKDADKSTTTAVATEENKEEEQANVSELDTLVKELAQHTKNLPKSKDGKLLCCLAEEFEKDNDANFHIDIIYAMANCRSSNYKLDPMDWITVKLKAGRIIPALATTTAAIAGLQTIELCKLIKGCKLEDMKNTFLSLAVPIIAFGEPGPAPTTKLAEKLTVNIWDRWDIKANKDYKLHQLFEELESKYELKPKDVMAGSQPIYFSAIMDIQGKENEKKEILNKKMVDLLGLENEDKYGDITVTFTSKEGGDILKGTPPVRLFIE